MSNEIAETIPRFLAYREAVNAYRAAQVARNNGKGDMRTLREAFAALQIARNGLFNPITGELIE